MLPVLVVATIGILYINTIQHNRFVKEKKYGNVHFSFFEMPAE